MNENVQRGAVLVESAFAVSLILIFLYGSIQLGVVGLEQLTADGGAYTAAHQQALLGTNLKHYEDAPTLAKAALPHLNAPSIQIPEPTYGEPPTAEGPSVSQYNLSNSNARHGGVSMVQPVQTVSFVINSNFASLLLDATQSISVTGIAIDPAFRLINGHGDLSGYGFNTTGAFSTASDPLVNGNNAPPYFIGFNYMRMCEPFTACANTHLVGLGLAEYLDVNNWGRGVNGVVPDGRAVFYEALLHQDKFAAIATKLSVANAAPTIVLRDALKRSALDPTLPGPAGCVYSFDNDKLGSYTVGTVQIGDFPLNPGGNPVACSAP